MMSKQMIKVLWSVLVFGHFVFHLVCAQDNQTASEETTELLEIGRQQSPSCYGIANKPPEHQLKL